MRYTVSSGGVTIGETDLGFVRCEVAVRAGWFHPNAAGERLLPRILPPLALHREDGSVVPTRHLTIQDAHALLAVAELEEARREALPWAPECHALDEDDEPVAIHVEDDDEVLLAGVPPDLAVEWAPDDEPTEHPRYQIILELVDDGAIP